MQCVFTPETFALTFAPALAENQAIILREARARLWRLAKTLLLPSLRNGEEMEFPFGNGTYYKKMKGEYFFFRVDRKRVLRALKRMKDFENSNRHS